MMRTALRFSIALVASSVIGAFATSAIAQTFFGTAFAVTEDGDLVTNKHVVSGCSRVEARLGARRLAGEVTVHGQGEDLAIIRLHTNTPDFAVFPKLPALRAGESAITYGFPLPGMLASDGNLTIGYVTALQGPVDSPHYVQVTTPIQPGNSGGPLLDSSGHVIGVVTKQLNAAMFQDARGVPQLVNFAIGLDALRSFLNQNKIPFTEQDSFQELRPADVGDRARLFSYSVHCTQDVGVSSSLPLSKRPPAGAERAAFYEEDAANVYGRRFAGSVTWGVGTSQPEEGHSRRPTLRADIQIPDRTNALLTLKQAEGGGTSNSYRIEIAFHPTDTLHGNVAGVAGILMKAGEQARGLPINVRTLRTGPGTFVIELSGTGYFGQQNLDLLREREWIDIPIIYEDGRRAIMTLAKGASGLSAFDAALAASAGDGPRSRAQ